RDLIVDRADDRIVLCLGQVRGSKLIQVLRYKFQPSRKWIAADHGRAQRLVFHTCAPKSLVQSGGPRMSKPTATDAIEASRTIPAGRSFECRGRGWTCGEARSIANSIAVFSPSRISTSAIVNAITAHSTRLIFSHAPSRQAAIPSVTS